MRRVGLIPLCIAVVVSRVPAPASAQVQVAADAGLSRLHQAGITESTARTLGLSVDALTNQLWVRSSLLGAISSSSVWTGQGVAAASWFSRTRTPARWEISAIGSAFVEPRRQTALSGELFTRAHVGSPTLGGALGVGGGLRRADTEPHPFGHAQASVWLNIAGNRLLGDVSAIRTSTERLTGRGLQTLSYVDGSVTWRRDIGGLSLSAIGGGRTTESSRLSDGGWWGVDAAAYVAPRFGIIGGAGQTLDDVVRGVPRTRYLSIGVRWSGAPHATIIPRKQPRVAGPRLVVERKRIVIRAGGASRVELMGDFTKWAPVALAAEGDVWRLDRVLTPGLHRIAIRIDGGDWIAPVNLPHATDDLGGVVGLITIPDE